MNSINVFISYSHKDELYKDELLEFLSPLEGAGEIKIWNDRTILVGDKWNEEIINALDQSDLIIFLMSSSFFASTYINKVEILKAMERHKHKDVRLVPIMLRDCDFQSHIVSGHEEKISDFQGLPTNMKPLNKWEPRDDGWMNVVNGLKPVLDLIKKRKEE